MRIRHSLLFIALLTAHHAYASCGSTACSINTNWDEHSASQPGLSMDLRYSYSQADQLRSGSSKIAADTTFAGEVENLKTVNKITTIGIDYTFDEHWGMALNAPFVSREHNHNLGPYTGSTSAGSETFSTNAMGDSKVIARYRWTLNEANHSSIGIKLGMKLNTGRQDALIVDNLGASKLPTEVTLQTGSGSTDYIVGAFWQQADPASSLSWFAQALSQSALSNRADFKPGDQFNVDAGLRYAFSKSCNGLLQINSQLNTADTGSNAALTAAGKTSTGGNSVSITPGVSYAVMTGTNVYGLLQLPLYQYVNGEQLTTGSAATLGINHRF